ncbi:MAG: IgA Peptidase M64 [Bacteroidales bacterium]|nr:IgA Peptidase M64 [Bacteroidales bacterium]
MTPMRHVLLILLCTVLVTGQIEAQGDFDRWFDGRTLRIDYHRIGNRANDTIELVRYVEKATEWAGPRTVLIDPFDNGDYRVSLIDVETGRTIYSHCYNTLFREYRDTKEGSYKSRTFEEVLLIPWPKLKADIMLEKRDNRQRFRQQATFRFDPRESLVEHVTSTASTQLNLEMNGIPEHKLDIVIVPEGYGPGEERRIRTDLQNFAEYIFGHEPFKNRRTDFNVTGLMLTGAESGVTNPALGHTVQSALGSTYGVFGSDRYLMTFNLFRLHDLLDAVAFDHIVIMAAASKYGGGAIYNFYATVSTDRMAPLILTHELGHSIGGLADEYVDDDLSYNCMHSSHVEPTEPNITSLVDFDTKWKEMLPPDTKVPTAANPDIPATECGPMGCYEGAGYKGKGMYRPCMHCMMRDYAPFCPVCNKRLNDIFDFYTK